MAQVAGNGTPSDQHVVLSDRDGLTSELHYEEWPVISGHLDWILFEWGHRQCFGVYTIALLLFKYFG